MNGLLSMIGMQTEFEYQMGDDFPFGVPRIRFNVPNGNIPSDKQKCQPKAQHEFTIKGIKIMAASKKDAGKLAGDHRLLKAMRLTKKWESRKIRNDVNKILEKNPFKPRDLQRSALRLMRYGCSKA